MDREAIRTSAAYKKLEDQYFDGGYYSPKVRELSSALESLTLAERHDFYRDHFNLAWSIADRVVSSGRFDQWGRADMTDEGLGVIEVRLSKNEEDGDDSPAFNVLEVSVTSFHPVSSTVEDWNWNKESDPMGLETSHPVTKNVRQYPEKYSDEIYALPDGSLCYDRQDEDLDNEILNLLNALETLVWADEVLAKSEHKPLVLDY